MSKKSSVKHLKDIDFRSREVRSNNYVGEFVSWYEELQHRLSLEYSDHALTQLRVLSAVLWHLLPLDEYHALTRKQNDI